MYVTATQLKWACIVIGATAYFFLGALTEIALPLQFGTFVAIAFVLPAVVTHSGSFDRQRPVETDGSGTVDGNNESNDEYRY